MAARYWTQAQRVQQSEKIRQWKPWARSTGARTPEGKAVSSRNAYKGGVRAMLREMKVLLREQKTNLNAVL
jgi:hypothetical protein